MMPTGFYQSCNYFYYNYRDEWEKWYWNEIAKQFTEYWETCKEQKGWK